MLNIFSFGILGNLCLGIGISLLLKKFLSSHYQDWSGEEGHDYEEWKTVKGESLKRLYKIGGVWGWRQPGICVSLWKVRGCGGSMTKDTGQDTL